MPPEAVRRRLANVGALALVAAVAAGCGSERRDTIRIGIYGDCYGPFPAVTEQSELGADLAFMRHGAKPNGSRPSAGVSAITVAGKRVELVLGCDFYRSHTSSLAVARRLVEQEGVDILVTPQDVPDDSVDSLYGPRRPGVTFLSTGSDPVGRLGHNVFRISPDNRQLSAGLGAYAFHTLGWRTAVTVEKTTRRATVRRPGSSQSSARSGAQSFTGSGSLPRSPTGRGSSGRSRTASTEWR